MKYEWIKLFSVINLILAAVSLDFGQRPAKDLAFLKQDLQTRLDEWHRSGKFAGATVGVCQTDGNCFALATGFSDMESKREMTPDDVSELSN